MKFLGVDTGGTFTDLILTTDKKVYLHKVLSTPDKPEQAILQGIQELGLKLDEPLFLIHGSTVATNAVLQRKGARTAYVTCRGFGDVLSLGRQARPELYQLAPTQTPPPVPAELCLETGGRITHKGEVLDPLSDEDLACLQQQIKKLKPEAIAINLLFSFVDKQFEHRIAAALGDDYFISCSSELLSESREYERGIVTWLNSYSGPIMQSYLRRLHHVLPNTTTRVMQSHGQTVSAHKAAKKSVHLLLSGPSGGVMAVHKISKLCGKHKALSFDMGGTSTDVSILDGQVPLTHNGHIGHYPIATPVIDIHTIGAGGGSIAYCDAGGLLHVGPNSAGAVPGPACYGKGGTQATVTDANLLLGYLPETIGRLKLNPALAEQALARLAKQIGLSIQETAEGVITVVNEQMAQALKLIATKNGKDPNDYVLVGFGAAGGLHICRLAENLRIQHAMIPAGAGILSALGMLTADQGLYRSQTLAMELGTVQETEIEKVYALLFEQAEQEMQEQALPVDIVRKTIALRYQGQWNSLEFAYERLSNLAERFHQQHEALYGFRLSAPIELVTARIQTSARARIDMRQVLKEMNTHPSDEIMPSYSGKLPLRQRTQLDERPIAGPFLIVESIATIFVAPEWEASRDELGNIHLKVSGTARGRH